ncbi:MAG: putative permease [Rhodobacteraceae bacterium HLUCCA12]|nr:MAG: putative permease [Rhodobacteraceae bacterium HLUCCA12]
MTLAHSGSALRAEALKGHAAMLLFSASVAGSFSLGAMVANDIEPAALNALRFLITAVILAGLTTVLGSRGYRRADFRAPWRYLLLGTIFAGYFVLMFEALKTASPVSAGAVFTLTPLMTAGFGWLLLRQVLNGWMALALAIGAGGAVWVIFDGDLGALMSFQLGRGEAIYFVGCVFHAAFTPLLRRLNRGEPALVMTSLLMAAGCVVLVIYGWRDLDAIDWASLPPLVWIALAYLALAANALTVVLLQFAGQRLPSSKVMAYTYLTPAWIILWELALGHGGPGLLVLPGIALIAVALVMLLRND